MKRRWTFDGGRDGFRYEDDVFRLTDAPRYAQGRHEDGALTLRLGGRDDATVKGMSGGWTRAFDLDEASRVTLSFKVKLKQGADTLRGEFADVRVAVDGDAVKIGGKVFGIRLEGDGPGGRDRGVGWRTIEVDLGPLAAGKHDFTIGGYANRKSSKGAFTEMMFDDVRIAAKPTAAARESFDIDPFEADVIRLTNDYRVKRGLDPLEPDPRLLAAAEDWSRTMAKGDFFRHSKTAAQIDEFGYDARGWGENIAAGYPTAKAVVDGWIKSPGHRANLLRADFEHIGVGHHFEKNDRGAAPFGHYWTQIFGDPSKDYLM